MTLTYSAKYGWTKDCPECGGNGFVEGDTHCDGFGGGNCWVDDARCDDCGGTGGVEAECVDFDGGEFLLNGCAVLVASNGISLTACPDGSDDEFTADIDDLRPLPALVLELAA